MRTCESGEAVATSVHRHVLPEFLSLQECKELEFIHKSNGVLGYRPFVLSTTLSHLVATNCAHLIIPILSVRERVKEAVEEFFGREYELFVEFTGLMSWTQGASIGWHSDDNRPYLQQRHYSAVCYLNTYEQDFKGGLFHFQEGEPSIILPSVGTLVIYTADERNIHRVDEVTEGERSTLSLWFSADSAHDEDQKLIQQISLVVPDIQGHLSDEPGKELIMLPSKQNAHHPVAASSVMYKAQNLGDEANRSVEGSSTSELTNPYFDTTEDLRIVRLGQMDFSCCFSCTAVDDQHDHPLMLTYRHQEVPHLFSSSLEALQVTQFHLFKKWSQGFIGQTWEDSRWKSLRNAPASSHSHTIAGHHTTTTMSVTACHGDAAPVSNEEGVRMESLADANEALVSPLRDDYDELSNFLSSVQQFQTYTSDLWRKLFQSFPSWRTTGSFL